MINCLQTVSPYTNYNNNYYFITVPPSSLPPSSYYVFHNNNNLKLTQHFLSKKSNKKDNLIVKALPIIDPWSPTIDSQSIASQLFAFSLFPYLGFLYFITRSNSAPKLTLFGFYFLLAFVGATIPAGIYAKVHYGTSLSNVDWLHGGAESLLTLTNLFIVIGLRQALRKPNDAKDLVPDAEVPNDNTPST
uniref:uncharacterized protein LOC122581408 n=1 Tax=Erigeron canadensis TaxID=72917 RepID=UPI001CB8C3EF|nr:uncharacterized protein LOC122581408 [Erigeron canadensis]